MELHILRDGEQLGPFSLPDARQHFAEGALLCTDLARHDGLLSWQPINQVLYEPLPEAPAPLEAPPEWQRFFQKKIDHSSHLEVADEILERHTFDGPKRGKYRNQIKDIRERAKDNLLYLAVVGEFSAGKSTFINALMKRDLLSRDILQGTTVSATFIRFGSHLVEEFVELQFANGKVKREESNGSNNFAEVIHQATAVEERAVDVKQVNLSIRSRSVLQNVVLIDTPGLNSNSSRHAEVTKHVVENDADLAIIVTDSNAPLSMTLTEFLHAHIKDSIARCLIVLTKVDMLESEDQRRVLANVKKRYLSEFGLSSALILPVSPLALLAQLKPKTYSGVRSRLGDESVDNFTSAFLANEIALSEFLETFRWGVLAERILRLLERLLSPLIEELIALSRICESQLALADREQLVSLDVVVRESLKALDADFNNPQEASKIEMDRWIAYKEQEVQNDLATRLNAAQDLQVLHGSLGDSSRILGAFANELQSFLARIAGAVSDQSNHFQAKVAQSLKLNFPFLPTFNVQTFTLPKSSTCSDYSKFNRHLATLESGYKATQESNNTAAGGGAAAGLVLGSILFPGVGTFLGPVIGYHVSKAMNQSAQTPILEKKNEYRRQVHQGLAEYFADAKARARAEISRFYNLAKTGTAQHVSEFGGAHRDNISQRIHSNDQAKQKLQYQHNTLISDRANLERRRDALRLAKEQLPDRA